MSQTAVAPPRQSARTLDIVSLVFAILLAPVGLVLAIVSGTRTRPANTRMSLVTLLAIVISAILAPLQTGVAALVVVTGAGIFSAANDDRYCDAVAGNSQILAAVGEINPESIEGTLSADEVEQIYSLLVEVYQFAREVEGLPSNADAARRAEVLSGTAERASSEVKMNAGWLTADFGQRYSTDLETTQLSAADMLADPEGLCR